MQNLERIEAVVVGAGPAGVGLSVALKKIGVPHVVLDQQQVGASFLRWPAETRFITPSFTSNAFGLLDLNAITPDTSPAFSLGKEHPSGPEYARYLQAIAKHFDLPIYEGVRVQKVQPQADGFLLHTSQGPLEATFVVWAVGEFQFPLHPFEGAELCLPYSQLGSFTQIPGDIVAVIGGYEAGADVAINLIAQGRKALLLDPAAPWDADSPEPSTTLSPYTRERLQTARQSKRLQLAALKVTRVSQEGERYLIQHDQGQLYSRTPPVLATGFDGGFGPVKRLFAFRQGIPKLTLQDESSKTPGLFLAGPKVRHGGAPFCFVYKFRTRFHTVASAIGARLDLDLTPLDIYRQKGMYVEDPCACTDGCAC